MPNQTLPHCQITLQKKTETKESQTKARVMLGHLETIDILCPGPVASGEAESRRPPKTNSQPLKECIMNNVHPF